MVEILNSSNFNGEVLSYNGTVLVDFYADWCGPCKMVSPIVDEIAKEHSDIRVGKVNIDNDGTLAIKYNVTSIPTLIVFRNGKEQSRIVGYRPKAEILTAVL